MILVDTHVVVWLAFDPSQLSRKARAAIDKAHKNGDGLAISDITLLELATLASKGRISLDISLESFLREVEARFVVLPISRARISGNVVLELCKAVESELASGLGTIRGLEFLARGTLGEKAHALKGITAFDDATTQRISSQGIKPDFVKSGLADSLKQLASLRSDTGSAHGNAQLQSASPQHADRARLLTGQILKGIVRVSRGKSK